MDLVTLPRHTLQATERGRVRGGARACGTGTLFIVIVHDHHHHPPSEVISLGTYLLLVPRGCGPCVWIFLFYTDGVHVAWSGSLWRGEEFQQEHLTVRNTLTTLTQKVCIQLRQGQRESTLLKGNWPMNRRLNLNPNILKAPANKKSKKEHFSKWETSLSSVWTEPKPFSEFSINHRWWLFSPGVQRLENLSRGRNTWAYGIVCFKLSSNTSTRDKWHYGTCFSCASNLVG